jgi:SAM-dependent methyltransferase
MDTNIVLNRPEPIVAEIEAIPFTKRMDPQSAVDDLVEGHPILIKDFYSSGLLVLSELRKFVKTNYADESYQGQRENRAVYRELSSRVLLQVRDNRLLVRKAPEIGWLKLLYTDVGEFLLPFAQVQGLNSAWQWFQKGISIPVLKTKVFPFYGTYFPTRFEHLEILDQWLKDYQGSKASAIDVGVGSGVMTYQLLNHGFKKIAATDSNPNAIHGMREALVKKNITAKVELFLGDLFADCNLQTDLIVFNPPWLPLANDNEGIDKAMYYDEDLFPRFFAEALKHLKPEGRLVLLFSNLAQVTHLTKTNPIEEELEKGGRFQKDLLVKSKVKAASHKTRRNQTWREDELVELWVLKPA